MYRTCYDDTKPLLGLAFYRLIGDIFVPNQGTCVTRKDIVQGYIKLHREILNSVVWDSKNSLVLKLWLNCLLSANHGVTKIRRGKDEFELQPGDFVYSRTTWSKKLQVPMSTLRNSVDLLTNWDMIEAIVTDKGIPTIYRVKNWTKWQDEDMIKDKVRTPFRTKSGQSEDTLKNDKNDKNDKNPPNPHAVAGGRVAGGLGLSEAELAQLGEDFPKVDIHKAYRHIKETQPPSVHVAPAYVRKRIQTMIEDGSYPRREKPYLAKIGDRTFYDVFEYEQFMATGV